MTTFKSKAKAEEAKTNELIKKGWNYKGMVNCIGVFWIGKYSFKLEGVPSQGWYVRYTESKKYI